MNDGSVPMSKDAVTVVMRSHGWYLGMRMGHEMWEKDLRGKRFLVMAANGEDRAPKSLSTPVDVYEVGIDKDGDYEELSVTQYGHIMAALQAY